jgi:hypothetical protein
VCISFLRCNQNSVRSQNSQTSSSMTDGFHGILNLIETTFWREDSRARVITTCLKQENQKCQ